jgi:outer membrane protein
MRIRLLFALFGFTLAAGAQTESPQTRAISLQDCIAMALQHNLELRIERYNPELALFNLQGSYGAYDPLFRASAQYDYAKSGKTVFQSFNAPIEIPGQEKNTDTFSSSLGGLLPWGMSYSLSGRVADTDATRFRADNSGNIFAQPYSDSSGSVLLGVTQPLLKDFWLNPTRLNISVYKNRLKWTELGLRQRIMDVVTRVELNYYDLSAALENVKVQAKALELAQRLLEENKKRVEVGTLAPLDEKQAESDVAARQADLISAEQSLGTQENLLKRLLSDDFAGWNQVRLEPTESLSAEREFFNLQDSWSKGLTMRPEFLQAKLDVERQGIEVKINQNQLYPQLDLKAGGGFSGTTPEYSGIFGDISRGDQPSYYVGGQFSFPLGNRTARNNYKASKADYEVMLLSLKKTEQDIMIAIDEAINVAKASYDRVNATKKAVEFAQAALDAEQKKLENGKSTSFIVLRLQRDLTTARSDEIRALANYKRALALLAQVEGSTLERRGVNLEVK